MEKRDIPGVHRYDAPAGGWRALRATAHAVAEQMHIAEAPALLLRTNKPDGFDCPGCAWPDCAAAGLWEVPTTGTQC